MTDNQTELQRRCGRAYRESLGAAYPEAAKLARELGKSIEELLAEGWEYKGKEA